MTAAPRTVPLAALMFATSVAAQPTTTPARYANAQIKDPAKEAEARALMETLRCLVCQGQSIADSDAEMAGDMRSLVRERIAEGKSAADVRAGLIASYGDYVSYDPPLSRATAALWFAPLLLLAVGGAVAARNFRRRRS